MTLTFTFRDEDSDILFKESLGFKLELWCGKKLVVSVDKLESSMDGEEHTVQVAKDATCYANITSFEPIFNISIEFDNNNEGIILDPTTTRNEFPKKVGNLQNLTTNATMTISLCKYDNFVMLNYSWNSSY